MSNPALYYIKWLVYSASDGFGNGWKKIFYQFGSQFISGQQSPKTPCLFKETLDILINNFFLLQNWTWYLRNKGQLR